MKKQRVLFICVHNSARSQMAEAWLSYTCGEFFEVHSAGLESGMINPLVIQVMAEVGIDLSHKTTQRVCSTFGNPGGSSITSLRLTMRRRGVSDFLL